MAKTLTTVYKNSQDQYSTTIPKALAESMDWGKGDKLRWKVSSKNVLEVRKVERDEQE